MGRALVVGSERRERLNTRTTCLSNITLCEQKSIKENLEIVFHAYIINTECLHPL